MSMLDPDDMEKFRGKTVPKQDVHNLFSEDQPKSMIDTGDGFPSWKKSTISLTLKVETSSRKDRVLAFIANERKLLYSVVADHAAKMEGEAIVDEMMDIQVLDKLEEEAVNFNN